MALVMGPLLGRIASHMINMSLKKISNWCIPGQSYTSTHSWSPSIRFIASFTLKHICTTWAWFTNNMHMVYFWSPLEIPIPRGFDSRNIFRNPYAYHGILLTHILIDIMHSITISTIFTHAHNNLKVSLHPQIISVNIMHQTMILMISILHSYFSSYATITFIQYNIHIYTCNPIKLLLILLER